jgi:penicillin-binding protein 1A
VKKIVKALLVLFALTLIGVGFIFAVIGWVSSDLPQINSLADYRPPMNSKILSRDGTLLLEIGKETRDVVEFKDIPPRIVGAFLAAEDDNFYNHKGVDYVGIARAFMVNLKEGRLVQGGSTITQQVAKSLLLTKERTISRKIKDLLLAQKIEEKFSKEDILFLYLNQVYLGGGYYGVKAAVSGYFDKELEEATVAESALIAGLLVAPGRYSPYVNPTYAKRRQLYVLKRMYETGKITFKDYEMAKLEDIKMRLRTTTSMKGGHFTDWIRQQVIAKVGEDEFLTEGFEVVTTLDWTLQEKAETTLLSNLKELDKRQGFKGPMGSITDSELLSQELSGQRDRIYKEKSTYFYFSTKGKNKFEFETVEDEWEKLNTYFEEEQTKIESKYKEVVYIGNKSDDQVVKLVDKDRSYPAIVLKVNDEQRVIYASIAGIRVVIPESGFSWAHPRQLDEEPKWYSPVTKPSTILKTGDQIQLKVTGLNQNVWAQLNQDYRKKITDEQLIKIFKQQMMLVGELDQKPDAEGAFVAMDPRNGNVLTMVGGSDFSRSQFNRALQAARQPGSAFKPFIYAAALENGYHSSSVIFDTPQALGGATDNLSWKPRNYDGEFKGQMTFRKALEVSRNIPTIKILQDVGVPKMIDFVERLGLKAQLPQDMSISLGSFGISLTELVKGYAIFANGGKKIGLNTIVSVKDRNDVVYDIDGEMKITEKSKELVEEPIEGNETQVNPWTGNLSGSRVYDPRLAHIMSKLLEGVILYGTGGGARDVSPNIAGKTGTTNNFVDALFVGFSGTVVAGSWVGFDNNLPLGHGETGGKTALPIWKDFMEEAIKKYGAPEFLPPEGIVNIMVNKETGRPLRAGESNGFMETFAEGMNPFEAKQSNSSLDSDESTTEPDALEDEDYYMNQ